MIAQNVIIIALMVIMGATSGKYDHKSLILHQNKMIIMKYAIHLYRFHRNKYGRDLRCDAFPIDYFKHGLLEYPIHRESFYCIILVEEGETDIVLNNYHCHLSASDVICGLPGEIWEWTQNIEIKGRVVIFEPEFVLSIMKDPMILDRLRSFGAKRATPYFKLSENRLPKVSELMREMDDTIHSGCSDIFILKTLLLHLLALLDSDYPENKAAYEDNMTVGRYAAGFVKLVGVNLYRYHDVEYYADRLCITPNYLNKISHQALGLSSRGYIQSRIIAEAKNLLSITTMTSSEVSATLGFESPSYFSRLFKKCTGMTPLVFRERSGKEN